MTETLLHNEWSGKTDGLPWMQRSLIAMFKVLPLWLLYGVMALVVPFYMIFGKGFKSIYRFFHEGFGYGSWKSFWMVYANHFRFGQVILDRFGAYAGKHFIYTVDGQSVSDELEQRPEGFVQLSCHVGNYEMSGYTVTSRHKKFHILAYAGETETVMANRERVFAQHNVDMILVKEDLSHLFVLNTALDNGDIVSMMADRVFGSQKTIECQFLSKKVQFPLGPFSIAVGKNVPVLAVFVMKEGMRKYHITIRRLTCNPTASKRDQITQMAQQFVAMLEETIRKYPTQWFNYFDFWKNEYNN